MYLHTCKYVCVVQLACTKTVFSCSLVILYEIDTQLVMLPGVGIKRDNKLLRFRIGLACFFSTAHLIHNPVFRRQAYTIHEIVIDESCVSLRDYTYS